ncbi:unnamed protein product, partial [Acanthoscelides obtectus]
RFVKDYAIVAKPLTNLLRKSVSWRWGKQEEGSFRKLHSNIVSRPVLVLYDTAAAAEVHCDASMLGVAGIILEMQPDERLHPVAYYSRQTTDGEQKYHSYELETLAVVESLKKFRKFDCEVKYRPGAQKAHVDCLSSNSVGCVDGAVEPETVFRVEQADWVLSGRLTDEKIRRIHNILSRPPTSNEEKQLYKDYALRDGRVYRIRVRGIQWTVPRSMRYQVVKAVHDYFGRFAVDKTLYRLTDHYWFSRMRKYVEKYISCCIPCLYNKRPARRKEGFSHPIPKTPTPFFTVHVDHIGPFPKSRKGNCHILAIIDGSRNLSY